MNASHIKELALTLGNGIAIILAVIYLKGYLIILYFYFILLCYICISVIIHYCLYTYVLYVSCLAICSGSQADRLSGSHQVIFWGFHWLSNGILSKNPRTDGISRVNEEE